MRKSLEAVPVELWLWAARIVKTREAAAAAIAEGRLQLDGAPAAAGALVRPDARLVLVGDPHQLSSVEAGAVLSDVVRGFHGRADSPVAGLRA